MMLVRSPTGHLAMCRTSTYDGHVSKVRGPMREPTYFVLAALLGGPLHGYGIIQRAGELSGGRVRLATGTLYTALDRLTAEGLLELVSEENVNRRAPPTSRPPPECSAPPPAQLQRMA